MNPAKHDHVGVRIGRFPAQHEGISNVIGVFDDAVALVMVSEKEHAVTKASTNGVDGVRDVLLFR